MWSLVERKKALGFLLTGCKFGFYLSLGGFKCKTNDSMIEMPISQSQY